MSINSNCSELKLRDSAKSFELYSKKILDVESLSNSARKRVTEGKAKKPNSMRNLIFMNHLEIAKIMYCRGDSYTDIQHPIERAINEVAEAEGADIVEAVYTAVLDMASLIILLKMPSKVFSDLKTIVDRCNKRDQVLDYLISQGTEYKRGEAGQSAMMTYTNLNRVIDCKEQDVDKKSRLKYLLSYMNDVWHEKQIINSNMKIRTDPEIPYAGIFCFPVAAIAFIDDIDDAELRDSEYYPTDIADYVRKN